MIRRPSSPSTAKKLPLPETAQNRTQLVQIVEAKGISKPGKMTGGYAAFRSNVISLFSEQLNIPRVQLEALYNTKSLHRFAQAVATKYVPPGNKELFQDMYWVVRAKREGIHTPKDIEEFVDRNVKADSIHRDLKQEIDNCHACLTAEGQPQNPAFKPIIEKATGHRKSAATSHRSTSPATFIPKQVGERYNYRHTVHLFNAHKRGELPCIAGCQVPEGSKPRMVRASDSPPVCKDLPNKVRVTSYTSIQAANEAHSRKKHPIITNSANENHRGGGSGIHYDHHKNRWVVNRDQRARAQEENLCEKSTIRESLQHINYSHFNSKANIFLSDNYVFGTDPVNELTDKTELTTYSKIITPFPATFVHSAALHCSNHPGMTKADVEKDMRARIELQLKALAQQVKQDIDAGKEPEIILTAFGCGVFSGAGHQYRSQYEYSKMIAGIYKELIDGEFKGQLGSINFTVPPFESSIDENLQAFQDVFTSGSSS